MSRVKSGLVLISDVGESQPLYGRDPDVHASLNYTKAKMDDTESFYVVHQYPAYGSDGVKVIDKTTVVDLKWAVRSYRGFDKNGIVLFEYFHYGGNDAHNFTGKNHMIITLHTELTK